MSKTLAVILHLTDIDSDQSKVCVIPCSSWEDKASVLLKKYWTYSANQIYTFQYDFVYSFMGSCELCVSSDSLITTTTTTISPDNKKVFFCLLTICVTKWVFLYLEKRF